MHYVSLLVEFLRGRPAVVFWTAASDASRALDLDPRYFLQRPSRGCAAVAGDWSRIRPRQLSRTALAFWLGEIAFRIGGSFGLYALAQACIVVTYWAVFTLAAALSAQDTQFSQYC